MPSPHTLLHVPFIFSRPNTSEHNLHYIKLVELYLQLKQSLTEGPTQFKQRTSQGKHSEPTEKYPASQIFLFYIL